MWYFIASGILISFYAFYYNESSKTNSDPIFTDPIQTSESERTTIITFTDILYFETTKIWLQRMLELGYAKQIKIYALDDVVYKNLKLLTSSPDYSDISSNQIEIVNDFFTVDKTKRTWKPNTKKIWHIRIQKISSLLQEGKTVLITDVDSIWNKFVDLESVFPDTSFDSVHSICGNSPKRVKNAWGFTLCGGFAIYRPTMNNIQIWRTLEKRCKKKCDDQEELNLLYYENDMQFFDWKNDGEGRKFKEGVLKSKKLKILILDEDFVLRGSDPTKCKVNWVMNPRISAKDGNKKLQMLQKLQNSICPINN